MSSSTPVSVSDSAVPVVQPGSFLTLHYRLAGPAGDVINTFGGLPATLSLGTGELVRPWKSVCWAWPRARATFELPAGAAFGERNPDMQQWSARKALNELGDPMEQYTIGDVVQFPTPDGSGTFAGTVLQVREGDGAVRFQPSAGGPACDFRSAADRRALSH